MAADPTEPDPFAILGIPPAFDLNPADLGRAFRSLAARLHPDIARGDPEAARRAAAANRARATLEDPESRANALLARLGGPSKEQDRSLPDGFLAGMLETRVEIETAQASGETDQIDRWRRWVAGQRAEYLTRVSELFARAAAGRDSGLPSLLKEIRAQLNAWRYVERLIEQLEPRDPATPGAAGGEGPARR